MVLKNCVRHFLARTPGFKSVHAEAEFGVSIAKWTMSTDNLARYVHPSLLDADLASVTVNKRTASAAEDEAKAKRPKLGDGADTTVVQ